MNTLATLYMYHHNGYQLAKVRRSLEPFVGFESKFSRVEAVLLSFLLGSVPSVMSQLYRTSEVYAGLVTCNSVIGTLL